jgi:RNAse (barnase) inhibitor barstar
VANADTRALTVAHATSSTSLHEMLAAALDFPDYYGKNWDAFWDCLRCPERSAMPRTLIIRGLGVLEKRLPKDAARLRGCLVDGPREARFKLSSKRSE